MASGHVNRTNRPNTWLHRPSLRREKSPCQLGAVHTWHNATLHWEPPNWPLSQAERTCREHREHTYATRLTHLRRQWANFVVTHNAALW